MVPACNDDLGELGIVENFKHPGGDITGQLKLTLNWRPNGSNFCFRRSRSEVGAVLWTPAYSEFKADWRELRTTARMLGVTPVPSNSSEAAPQESLAAVHTNFWRLSIVLFHQFDTVARNFL